MVSYNLSVITISFNIADEIERTCKSIVNQSFQDFEWIVIDGASTDGTLEVLKKYRYRMNVFVSEPDKGIYNAMNKGIKRATGKYLLFINGGDELYEDDSLQKAINYSDDKYQLLSFGSYFHETGELWFSDDSPNLFYKTIPHGSTFIMRSLFSKYGLYDESFKIAADYDFFAKVFKKNKFKSVKILIQRFYKDGISGVQTPTLTIENLKIQKKYFKIKLFYLKHEDLINCLLHPRYLAGKIKSILK